MDFLAWQERWIWDTWGTSNGCQWLEHMWPTGRVFWKSSLSKKTCWTFRVSNRNVAIHLGMFEKIWSTHLKDRMMGSLNSLDEMSCIQYPDLISSQRSLAPSNTETKHTWKTNIKHLIHIPLSESLPPTTNQKNNCNYRALASHPSKHNKLRGKHVSKERYINKT